MKEASIILILHRNIRDTSDDDRFESAQTKETLRRISRAIFSRMSHNRWNHSTSADHQVIFNHS